MNESISQLAESIKLVIFDVDGILTDGTLYYSNRGDTMKTFHVHDGLGISFLRQAGLKLAIITGRTSKMVVKRAKDLGIDYVYQGAIDKITPYEALIKKLQLTDNDVAYIGDDLLDLPLIRRVKLGITVPQAPEYVKEHANWVTEKPGGNGAVREMCDLILRAQGKFDEILAQYL